MQPASTAATVPAGDLHQQPGLHLRVPSGDDIARRAYEFYEQRGRQHGQDRDDWLAAERELRQRALRELLDTILVTGSPYVVS
jgi:hypothetical protein